MGWLSKLGSCRKPWLCSSVWHCFFFFFFWWANQILLLKDLRKSFEIPGAGAGGGVPICSVEAGLVRDRRHDISCWLAIL